MARVVEAVQIFKKVEEITAAKDDPPPAYLMDELAEMARGSAESSEKIADRIAKRLQNKSPVVKYKALRLVRHLLNKGCGQFQRSMQRHANLIRENVHFKGESDPFKGDTPNQRVRDAAKEASEALFNTVMAQPITSLGSRIQGFGSSAAPLPSANYSSGGPAGSGSSSSGSRMVGFGSSGYTAPTSAASANGSGGLGSAQQKSVSRPLTGHYGDGSTGTASGGGYGAGGGGGYTAPVMTAMEVLGSEAQLVDSICTPGGLRLAPDADDLRRFVEAAGNLDGLKLAELLRDKMMDGSGPWQQLLRALYALEAVLLVGATQACGEIAVMFQSDPGPVQAAAGHTQATVRERAGRVLRLLLGEDQPVAAAAAAAAAAAPALVAGRHAPAKAAAPQTTTDDLLGSPVQGRYNGQQQQHRPATAGGAGADDMFSGLALLAGSGTAQQSYASGVGAANGRLAAPLHQQQHLPPTARCQQQAAIVDSFELLQPAAVSAPNLAYAPPPPHQQQHQQQNLQPAYGDISSGGVLPSAAQGPGAAHAVQASRSAAAPPASQAANVRLPLDDMFADMSLSTSNQAAVRQVVGPGGGGACGSTAHGGVSAAYGASMAGGASGNVNPASSFTTPGGPQGPVSAPSSSSGGNSMGALGPSQYGAPGWPWDGLGRGMALGAAPPSQHHPQQFIARPPASAAQATSAGAVGGGVDLLCLGPTSSGAGMMMGGAWAGPGAGGYGTTAGVAGPGLAGMAGGAPYAAGAPGGSLAVGIGPAMGIGMGGNGGGGMMVGPGGQVRYVGQPSNGVGPPGGGLAPASGQLPQQQHLHATAPEYVYGGWQQQQQQPYATQQQKQQQHILSAGLIPQQEQQRGGAAFDFVKDHFK